MPQGQTAIPDDATLQPINFGGVIRPSGAATTDNQSTATGQPSTGSTPIPTDATMAPINPGTPLNKAVGYHLDDKGQPVLNETDELQQLYNKVIDDPIEATKSIAKYGLDAAERNAASMGSTAIGLPEDIRQWPEAIKQLANNPLTGKPDESTTTINGIKVRVPKGGIFNAPANIAKGIVTGSAAASQEGLDQLKQPGVANKAAGVLKYVIGGLPIAGPNIVKAMDYADNHDYARMLGTLQGIGLQALMANPDAAAARLKAAGTYLLSKPAVQEGILGQEAQEVITDADAKARSEASSSFPDVDKISNSIDGSIPGHQLADAVNDAIDKHIQGTQETPSPLKPILKADQLKSVGFVEKVGGGLQQLFTRMSSDSPVSLRDLHGYYTELGDYMSGHDLPGDVYNAVKQAHSKVGDFIGDIYKNNSEGKFGDLTGTNLFDQWELAKRKWSDYMTRFRDPGSPLKQAMDAANPHNNLSAAARPGQTLSALTGDNETLARSYLDRYNHLGVESSLIDAAAKLKRGMNKFSLRGLLQSSGGLLLSYMLRSAGAPANVSIYPAMGMIASRLGLGYFETRPTLRGLLSQEATTPSSWRSFPLKGDLPPGSGMTGSTGTGGIPGSGGVPSVTPTSPFIDKGDISTPTIGDIVHNSSTLTSSDINDLKTLSDHPVITQPDLKEDIKAAVSQPVSIKSFGEDLNIVNMSLGRIKGIMSIMRKQGIGYGEATKLYDAEVNK